MKSPKTAKQAYLSRAAGGAALGAIIGFCVWLFSGSQETVRIGPFRLSDETVKSWLPGTTRSAPVLITLGGVLGSFGGFVLEWLHQRRVAKMTVVATSLGHEYHEEADDEIRSQLAHCLSRLKKVAHVFRGGSNGVPFHVADVTQDRETGNSNAATLRHTICFLPIAGLPDFALKPRRFGDQLSTLVGIGFPSIDWRQLSDSSDRELAHQFARAWTILPGRSSADPLPNGYDQGRNDRECQDLLTIGLLKSLMPFRDCSILLQDGQLLVWRGTSFVSAERRRSLIDAAFAIRSTLLESRKSMPGQCVPLQRGAAPEVREKRLFQSMVGAGMGAFLGFGAGGALGMWRLSNEKEFSAISAVLFFAMPLCGLMVGGTTGAWLGCKLGSWASKPLNG